MRGDRHARRGGCGFRAVVSQDRQTIFGWRGEEALTVRCIPAIGIAVVFAWVSDQANDSGRLVEAVTAAYRNEAASAAATRGAATSAAATSAAATSGAASFGGGGRHRQALSATPALVAAAARDTSWSMIRVALSALAFCLVAAVPAAQSGTPIVQEAGWQEGGWPGIARPRFEITPQGTIRVAGQGQGGFLWRWERRPAECLSWRWRVDQGPPPPGSTAGAGTTAPCR